MTHSPIAYLVPLSPNFEENASTAKLHLSNGQNTIGRNDISVSDKRLSRNHLSLNLTQTSSTITVEGTNPVVVVKSGNKRRRLRTGEKEEIVNDDIIELIPGNYFYKYVLITPNSNLQKRGCFEGRENGIGESKRKKIREGISSSSKVEMKKGGSPRNFEEAIRDFVVSEDELGLTFRPLRVKELPAWANTSCVSINDVIKGDILAAILSNYMVDMDWLLSACPTIAKVPNVMVIHGEGEGTLEHMKRRKPANWILHKPRLPISFGTHHSKAMFLVYPQGVRVIVHTANLIFVDWNNKSQGLWMQDFPWKEEEPGKGCGFENDLVDYLSMLKWPEFIVKLPNLGSISINASFFKKFDYSNAVVRLIASVPGYHTGANLRKWGHMKLRNVLQECTFDNEFKRSPLVYQFSSLGSLDEKWMTELASSMSSGCAEDKTPLGLGEPQIIWPTVEDVRCSLEGYAAGNAIPSPLKNVEKGFLKKYWAKWKASHTGRCRAMPHIKTFTRYNGQKLAWFLLTSSNLSKAAWGALQKNNSQLMIRSYELGVLFLPSSIKRYGSGFSCTSNGGPSMDNCGSLADSEELGTKLATLKWQGTSNLASKVILLPVPYELPPEPYSSEDVPWSWDRRYSQKDVYGQVWPRTVQLYTSQD
ncbi:TYROSYL-DNA PHOSPHODIESTERASE 1 [Salix viminalis]|uniref:TYROSYL-DNA PHOSPHODIESTERASE 1 n=1 Tax=Salix viminalis TaxID=40686 RepID=A0A9Q0QHX7_SALVM|nr:TYROSYL-DNA PHOSPHODIESTERASE 1 [Salix viminalis]